MLNKVVIVGAGLGGLTAAYRLKEAGIDVTVLEAAEIAGGRVRTIYRDGFTMDVGADAIATQFYPEYLQLLEKLGLSDAVAPSTSTLSVLRDGQLIDLDLSRPLLLPFTSLLSWKAKLQLALGVIKVLKRKLLHGLSLSQLFRNAKEDDPEVSARDLSMELFGTEVSDYLIDAIAKIHNSMGSRYTSTLDLRYAITPMSLGAVVGGQARVTRTLADQLPIQFNSRVEKAEVNTMGKVEVCYRSAAGEETKVVADGCIIATMYEQAAEIYPWFAEISENYRSQLRYMQFVKIHLAYNETTKTDSFVVLVPEIEDEDTMMIFLDSHKCRDRAPDGCSLISPIISGRNFDKYMRFDDSELTKWARTKVEKFFPELQGHFLFSEITRWPIVTQMNVPGYYRKVAPLFDKLDGDHPIQVACDMFSKSSQETAVSWGNRAANNLIRQIRSATPTSPPVSKELKVASI